MFTLPRFAALARLATLATLTLGLLGCADEACFDASGADVCAPLAGPVGPTAARTSSAAPDPQETGTLEASGGHGSTDDCPSTLEGTVTHPDGIWPTLSESEYAAARHFRRAEPKVAVGHEGRAGFYEITVRVAARRVSSEGWEVFGVDADDDGTAIPGNVHWVWPVRPEVYAAMELTDGQPTAFRILVEFDTHQGSAILAVRHWSQLIED